MEIYLGWKYLIIVFNLSKMDFHQWIQKRTTFSVNGQSLFSNFLIQTIYLRCQDSQNDAFQMSVQQIEIIIIQRKTVSSLIIWITIIYFSWKWIDNMNFFTLWNLFSNIIITEKRLYHSVRLCWLCWSCLINTC